MTAATTSVLPNIHGNLPEWRACFSPTGEMPRLPLPFAFSALAGEGMSLAAVDSSSNEKPNDIFPFQSYFLKSETKAARNGSLSVIQWGTQGVRSCFAEAVKPRSSRKTVLFIYGWRPALPVTAKRSAILSVTRLAARTARGLILMTSRQVAAARADLSEAVPVVPLRVGIDTRFYARHSTELDVPEAHRSTVDKLLSEPYLILPGDELRLNADALEVVQKTGLRLVRISQYSHKSGTSLLKEEVARRRLADRVIVFERISYSFLRFLLQHAAAYAGFVDASWQPAGWTVACESLASGLPIVLYDGITAREMADLGLPHDLLRIVPVGDRACFANELAAIAATERTAAQTSVAQQFASRVLNAETTAPEFARNLAATLGGKK